MPMITRACSKNNVGNELVSNPVPSDIAPNSDSASISGALAPAPSSIPHPDVALSSALVSDELPSYSGQSALAPPSSYNSDSSVVKTDTRSSMRSTNTMRAQQLAVKVEHARRLVQIEAEREKAEAKREKAAAEREKALADLELQAELAVIASTSSRNSSKGDYVENWLVNSHANSAVVSEHANPVHPFNREARNVKGFGDAHSLSAPQEVGYTSLPPMPGLRPAAVQAFAAPYSTAFPCGSGLRATDLNTTVHAPNLGTHNDSTNCCYLNKNKTQTESGTQDSIILLANAIADLGKKTVVSEIPRFEGRALDWLHFKKAFEQSKARFTPSANIGRIAAALHGSAKEAVAVLLASAEEPEQIMKLLETRFAQPEHIVLQQLALVRGLPRLGAYEASQDLNVFACRIRNCVEVIRLLNQPEYLAAPELVNTVIGKLTPLLRSRWADFAAPRVGSGKFKLEILAEFLENESNLQIKFGFITPESTFVKSTFVKSQSVKPIKDKIYSISIDEEPKSSDLCLYCLNGAHNVSDCREFKALLLDDRWQWVLTNKVCRKCLRKGSHQYKSCKKKCSVEGCTANQRHHSLLHRTRSATAAHVEVQSAPSTSPNIEVQSSFDIPCTSVDTTSSKDKQQSAIVAHSVLPPNISSLKPLLKVLAVTITGPLGSIDTYALLDDGSSVTLLDQSVADLVGAKGPKCRLSIDCIGGLNRQSEISYVDIKVKGRHSSDTYEISARSILNLGIGSQSVLLDDIVEYRYLSDLVDVLCYDNAIPMLLIGTDNWQVTLPKAVRRGTGSQPAAAHTPLGWVLFGYVAHRCSIEATVNHVSATDEKDSSLDVLIKNYFNLESIGIAKVDHRSAIDERALRILQDTTRQLESGRFETGLLWRDNISFIPESRGLALARFNSLERKMTKDSSYADAYKQNIQSMISKGYAELCEGPPLGRVPWYLPHFGVIHPHKRKLRVVHDAAAKCAGVSLNSLLLTGPDLLQPLISIVMRFRERAVALTGDIREMFPQIKIRPEDRDSQRFLWRDNSDLPLQEFRMSSMIFGAASSPCTALWVKNKNASKFQLQYPDAVRSIIEDHYMDDYLGSFDSIDEAARRALEIVSIHKTACFQMTSWVSNHEEALAFIPQDLRATDVTEVSLGSTSPSQIRVLGLTWSVTEDKLYFIKSIPNLPTRFSKRSVLSLLMSIYDPLGFLTPVIMNGRILFQKTWKLGIDWDQNLSDILVKSWKSWFLKIKNFSNTSVPRCYLGSTGRVQEIQLHLFADASERAYACVAYWRFTYENGSVSLSLIGGKGRLAPLKPVSIPRLELQAALIAARFSVYITDAHTRKPNLIFYWTDSLTVLKWLRSDACTFKSFVSFRVGEIVESTDIKSWNYVPSGLNVADDATRDNGEFSVRSRWFTGPSFLLLPKSQWPSEPTGNVPPVTEEMKSVSEVTGLIVGYTTEPLSPPLVVPAYQRFSSWLRLLRATARVHQSAKLFRSFLRSSSKLSFSSDSFRDNLNLPLLSVADLNVAEIHLFRKVQLDSFSDDLIRVKAARPVSNESKLRNVSLLFGEDMLLRLSGRTAAAEGVESYPIVLDGKHPIVRLLIHSFHVKFVHGNNELVVNELRQKYYILGLRPAVRRTSDTCQFCRNRKAKPVIPLTGNLPDARLAHHQRPFTHVGLDYFGPVSVTICRRNAKRWIALFTCMTVRAVHLEVVETLSSDSALMALRRFIARRGCPAYIYSDNGTSFVGAAKILPELFNFCSNQRIEWKFIPPSAPFMGGCWERLVRSVKNAITVTLKDRSPKEEVLNTLLLEAECVVNSRPLTHVSVDEDSEHAITPFTFLIGSSSNDLPIGIFDDGDLVRRADWRKAQRLADHFWQRFVKEYLPTLVPRKDTQKTQQLQIGDLVFIADGTLPRNCWPRGRIVATHPGKDGIVRVVDVATKGGVLRRPSRRVALLVTGH